MPNREFWDWYREQYGEDYWWQTYRDAADIPAELYQQSEYHRTNIQPTPLREGEEVSKEDYEALAQTYLERQVEKEEITLPEYRRELARIQRAVDEDRIDVTAPYYREAVTLPDEWEYAQELATIKREKVEAAKAIKGVGEREEARAEEFEEQEAARIAEREAKEQEFRLEPERFKYREEALEARRAEEAEARKAEAEGRAYRPPLPAGEEYVSAGAISEQWMSAGQARTKLMAEEGVRVRVKEAQRLGVDISDLFPTTPQQYVHPGTWIQGADLRLDPIRKKQQTEWQKLAQKAKRPTGRPQRIARI